MEPPKNKLRNQDRVDLETAKNFTLFTSQCLRLMARHLPNQSVHPDSVIHSQMLENLGLTIKECSCQVDPDRMIIEGGSAYDYTNPERDPGFHIAIPTQGGYTIEVDIKGGLRAGSEYQSLDSQDGYGPSYAKSSGHADRTNRTLETTTIVINVSGPLSKVGYCNFSFTRHQDPDIRINYLAVNEEQFKGYGIHQNNGIRLPRCPQYQEMTNMIIQNIKALRHFR